MASTVTVRQPAASPRRTGLRRRPTRTVALVAALSIAAVTASVTSASAETIITPVLTGSTAEVDLVLETQVGPVDYGFGPSVWQVYVMTATNVSDADVTIGLGVDLGRDGLLGHGGPRRAAGRGFCPAWA